MTVVRTEQSRRIGGRLLAELREPLFRNGHALIVSSVGSSVIGVGFWLVAARRYSPDVFGRNSVALSTLTFIGGVAQLNLANLLIRFLGPAGARAKRYVVGCYLASIVIASLLGTGFVLVIPHLVPELDFIAKNPGLSCWWVASGAIWSVFVIEDGALTGLLHARVVPIENCAFGVAKLALVVALASAFAKTGIFLAWTLATLLTVALTNFYLFTRGFFGAVDHAGAEPVSSRVLAHYLPYDTAAALFWLVTIALPPLIVLRELGSAAAGYFNLIWTITYVLFLCSVSIGSSFVVELSTRPRGLFEESKRVMAHLAKLIVPLVLLAILLSHEIFALFGATYASFDPVVFDLLIASSIPFIVTGTVVNALRLQKRTREVFAIQGLLLAIVVSVTFAFTHELGLYAPAIGWLSSQVVVMCIVLALRKRLWPSEAPAVRTERSFAPAMTLALLRGARFWRVPLYDRPRWSRRALHGELTIDSLREPLVDLRALFPHEFPEKCPIELRHLAGGSDLDVLAVHSFDGCPRAVVKFPRTEQAWADLCSQQEVLRALREIAPLRAWARMLPSPVLFCRDRRRYSIESYLPGRSGVELVATRRQPAGLVTRNALASIRTLHESTECELGDEASIEQLLAGPVSLIRDAHPSGRPPADQLFALEKVHERVLAGLLSSGTRLSWVHGDFTPGNVLFSDDGREVMAIVDWCQGRRGIGAVDVMMWLISYSAMARRRQFGREVLGMLAERSSARALRLRAAGIAPDLDGEALVLAAWLDHVANNLAKSPRYERHLTWWSANVEPVLRRYS